MILPGLGRLLADIREGATSAVPPQVPEAPHPPTEPGIPAVAIAPPHEAPPALEEAGGATFTPAPPAPAPLPPPSTMEDPEEHEEAEARQVAARSTEAAAHAAAQRAHTRAHTDGRTPDVTIQIPAPRDLQRPILDHPARFKGIRAGRRVGKTRLEFIAAVRGHGPIINAETDPEKPPRLQRKWKGMAQGGHIAWIAPDYGQSETIWEEEILPRFSGRAGVTVSEKHRLIGFGRQLGVDANGEPVYYGTLRIRSAENINSLRGKKLDGIIIDEAAFLKLLTAWRRVLRPTLIDRGGWAIIASTTDIGSDFNQMMAQIEAGQRGPNWHAWHLRTRDNPYVSAEELADLRVDYPPGSAEEQQELDAELLETLGTLFREEYFRTYDAINSQAVWIDGLRYPFEYLAMAADVAASLKEQADYTALSIVGVCFPVDGIRRVALIEVVNERLEGPDQINAMEDLALRYRPTFIDIEAIGYQLTAVQHLRTRLQNRGLKVEGITLKGDKRAKAVPAAAAVARGEWYFPKAAPWLADTKAQLLKFPNGRAGSKLVADHDDIVDTFSLLAARIGGRANTTWKMRKIRGR